MGQGEGVMSENRMAQLGEVEKELDRVRDRIAALTGSKEAHRTKFSIDVGAVDLLQSQTKGLLKKHASGDLETGSDIESDIESIWEAIDFLLGQISSLSGDEAEQLHEALQGLGRRLEALSGQTEPREDSGNAANLDGPTENTAARAAPEPGRAGAADRLVADIREAMAGPFGPQSGRGRGETERDRLLWLQDRGRRVFEHGGEKTVGGLEALSRIDWMAAGEPAISDGRVLVGCYLAFTDPSPVLAALRDAQLRLRIAHTISSANAASESLAEAGLVDEAVADLRYLLRRLMTDYRAFERDFPAGEESPPDPPSPVVVALRRAELSGRAVSFASVVRPLSSAAELWPARLSAAAVFAHAIDRPVIDLAAVACDILLRSQSPDGPPELAHVFAEFLDFKSAPLQSLREAYPRDRPISVPALPLSPGLCGVIATDIERQLDTDGFFLHAMISHEARSFLSPLLGDRAAKAYAALHIAAENWLEEAGAEANLNAEDLAFLTPLTPAITLSPPLPEYTRDKPWIGEDGRLVGDPLGVVDDARALADLIALEKPGPPLAIGLFGDWGAGKSSFMEMLEQAIKENCDLAAAAREGGGEALPFVEHIAHIRFNAWHYAEANLWASLAAQIFRELLAQAGGPDTQRGKQIESLIGELGVAEEAAAEAREALLQAESEERTARKALADREREIADAEKALAEAEAGGDWSQIDVPEALGETMSALGLGAASPDAERLVELADEARGFGGHLRYFASAALAGSGPGWGRIVGSAALFLGVAVGALALPLLPGVETGFVDAAAGLGALIGGLAGLANWVLPHMRRVNEKLGELRSARDDVLRTRREAETAARTAAAAAAAELAESKAAARAATIEHAAKQEALRRAQALHAGERPGELFMKLIEARAGEDGYARHLGLVSQLHDDFQLMSDLLLKGESRGGKSLDQKDRPPIDRIVLYIDDLDRCPDETVIKVLEAVHLLLGLPLFVAVVGVDARWLEGALKRSYAAQLEAGEVRPEDYLEKIFQLPYWLRPMSLEGGGGFELLIESVMTDPERRARAELEAPVESGDVGETADDGVEDAEDGPQTSEDAPDSGEKSGDSVQLDYVDIPAIIEERIEARRQIVTLTPGEYAAIHALGPLIAKSPRATKRFMNLYRFEKARRMRKDAAAFTAAGEAEGVAVMFRLALDGCRDAQTSKFVDALIGEIGRAGKLAEESDRSEALQTGIDTTVLSADQQEAHFSRAASGAMKIAFGEAEPAKLTARVTDDLRRLQRSVKHLREKTDSGFVTALIAFRHADLTPDP